MVLKLQKQNELKNHVLIEPLNPVCVGLYRIISQNKPWILAECVSGRLVCGLESTVFSLRPIVHHIKISSLAC